MDIGAIFVGLALLLLTIPFVINPFQRKQGLAHSATTNKDANLKEERRMVLSALRDLEFDYQTGKVSQEDHTHLKNLLLAKAAQLMIADEKADEALENLIQKHRLSRRSSPSNCSGCQHPINPTDRFCPACGMPLEQNCPACGSEVASGARYCSSCGVALEPQADAHPA